jgi:tetratricopeptide (TPR) repeat protein
LLRDVGADESLAVRLLESARLMDMDDAAQALVARMTRLIVVDDVDRGGDEAITLLAAVVARLGASHTAVVVTSSVALGLGRELVLGPLSEPDLGLACGIADVDQQHGLWVASRGLPGPAHALMASLTAEDADPVVHWALAASSRADFLNVDVALVRLLELAIPRARQDGTRARVLARLAHELLGDASAGTRRRTLADEALMLARRSGNEQIVAEVLNARLHALWDPAGADDRLKTAAAIIDLARRAGDDQAERQGLFWRFITLMELGRVPEAESALALFDRAAAAAHDAPAAVMVTARRAMLAILRGRFDEALQLTDQVAQTGHQAGQLDTDNLVGTLRGAVAIERNKSAWPAAVDALLTMARGRPGHLYEALAARILAMLGREAEASAELERLLPRALASSGPRWLGAMADLAVVAVATHHAGAVTQLYGALIPYRGRIVVWAGANTTMGPVSYYLGLLATELGLLDDAVAHLDDAVTLTQHIGALPYLAHSLAALVRAKTTRAADGDATQAQQHQRHARTIAEQLGMTVFLERLTHPTDEWTLSRDGEDWQLQAGDERARLRDTRGIVYLRTLLAAPGRDIPALDLAAHGTGLAPPISQLALDPTAVQAYRQRLTALDEELDAADHAGDTQRSQRAQTEREALLAELRRTTGLGGRPRDISAETERARVNVTRTLRATLDRIAVLAPRAAAHLQTSIHTGRTCRYQPQPGGPTRWHL